MTAAGGEAGGSGAVGARRSGRGRRTSRLDPLAALLTALAVAWVVLAVGSPLLGRTTFLPTTILSTFAPWQASAPNDVAVTQYCSSDNVDAVLPERKEARDALRSGQVAQLDASDSGGADTALSQNAGLFDPVTLVPYTALPLRVAPAYEKVLELLVVLLGMVLWLRRLGMSTAAGIVGGFVYGSSGFMVVWTDWPQTSVACWVPMLFWSVERLAQRRDLAGGLLVALPLASMILGGFPAVTGWAVYAATAYLLLRLLAQDGRVAALVRGGLLAGLGAVLAVGLSAFQLLPFADGYGSRNFGYRTGLSGSLAPHMSAVTALFPQAIGGCGLNRGVQWFLAANPIEANVFVGTAAAVLVGVAVTGRLRPGVPTGPRTYLLLLAAFVANQIYLNDPLTHLVAHLPVFSGSPPDRLRVFLGLAAAALAGMGVDRVVARSWQPRWWRRPRTAVTALLWTLAAAATAEVALRTHRLDQQYHVGAHLLQGIVDAAVVAAVTALVVLLAAAVPRARVPAVVALACLVGIQGAAFARGFWPRDPNSTYYPVTPTHALLSRDLGQQRVAGDDGALRSGTSLFYGNLSPVGHAFVLPAWNQLLQAVDPTVDRTPSFLALNLSAADIGSPILDQMGVAYVVRSQADSVLGTPVAPPSPQGSVALAAGGSVTAPAGSTPLRAVGVRLAAPLSVAGAPYAAIQVALTDSAGTVVAGGTKRLYATAAADTEVVVPVTDTGGSRPLTARVRLVDDPHPTAFVAHAGAAALSLWTRPDDGLRAVLSDGAVVYQRTTALPRVRWASQAVVVPAGQQVATLAAGVPADEVVLDPGTAPAASGAAAAVTVRSDDGSTVVTDVDARGAGYLVVADAAIPGWQATVDGHPVALVAANHAMHAVPVPAGEHRVVVRYVQPGLTAGIVATLVTLVGYALLWALVGRGRARRRHRRPREATAAGPRLRPRD